MSRIRHIAQWARTTFPYPSPLAWGVLALVIMTDIVWAVLGAYHLSPNSLSSLGLALVAFVMLAGFAIYGRGRDDLAGVVAWSSATLFVVTFSTTSVILSYLAASLSLPLVDAQLVAFDEALGFDWIGLLHFVNTHETFGRLTSATYNTAFPELALIVLFLGLMRRLEELRELVDVYWLTLLMAITLSALFPAVDPYAFYGLKPDDFTVVWPTAGMVFLPDYLSLRAGTYDTFNFAAMEGIIAFPSFHAALALMMTWSLRRLPWALGLGLVYNGLMLLATLTEGGHYLADVAVGSLLVVVAVAVRHALTRREKPAVAIETLQALQGFD
ncbi:MAG: phosphatase PAP2 family protein [Parvibaculum sp.]|nr:phosphatase PAP2 family protein [Parvibaculum sp.]